MSHRRPLLSLKFCESISRVLTKICLFSWLFTQEITGDLRTVQLSGHCSLQSSSEIGDFGVSELHSPWSVLQSGDLTIASSWLLGPQSTSCNSHSPHQASTSQRSETCIWLGIWELRFTLWNQEPGNSGNSGLFTIRTLIRSPCGRAEAFYFFFYPQNSPF